MIVHIKVFSLINSVDISINTDANTFLCNGKVVSTDTIAFVTKLQHITGSWSEYLVDSSIRDGASFYVCYKGKSFTKTYSGVNRFPLNYAEFEKLIGGVM